MRAPTADREIELKVLVEPLRLPGLIDRLRARPEAFSALEVLHLESRYFDTADLRLARRRVTLRVRRVGDRFIQTLKTASVGGSAHTVRGEWECAVDGMAPAPERIGDPAALDALGLVLPEELQLIFTTRVERQLLLVEQPVGPGRPAIIEVAVDLGTLEADGRSEPVAELELELKAGPTEGLYHLLESLRDWAPLRVAVADKAQRGYRLAAGQPPAAQRAGSATLSPAMTVGDAMAVVLASCLGQWLHNDAAARDGRDPEGIHQLRIAVRRTRSALALFGDALDPDQRRAWNTRLKAVLAATGPARELDVFLTETLPTIAGQVPDEAALASLRARASSARDAAYASFRAFQESRAYADLVLDLALWLGLRRWQDTADQARAAALETPIVALATRLLGRRHKRVRAAGRHFAHLADAEWHEVRLALKKLRYGVEFLSGLFAGKPAKRYAKAAAELQDVLGELNDQAGCRRLLDALAARAPARPAADRLALERGIGLVLGWQAETVTAQRRRAIAAWQAFADQRPFWHAAGDAA